MVGRTSIMAIIGGTFARLGGGKFANGALSAAFYHLFNGEYNTLWKALKHLWQIRGKIKNDAIRGLKGGWQGYKDVRDNSPWYTRLMLKIGITGFEEGVTAGLAGWSRISFDMFSGAYLDSFPTSRYSIMGFYIKAYMDDLRGVYYKKIKLNPFDF